MNAPVRSRLPEILRGRESAILSEWVRLQIETDGRRRVSPDSIRQQSRELLAAICDAVRHDTSGVITTPEWAAARGVVDRLTHSTLSEGASASEVAMFVFSLKQPIFAELRREYAGDAQLLADETWFANTAVDRLGLYATEVYQKARNEIIMRQQAEMLELSTPVVQLWQGILALPLIGTLDSARTQVVMENLLAALVRENAEIAIIDITGVPTVDTLVAQHLLKTVAAARLMGAECIISGIRPQIAQTIIHLGVDLANVITKATLADAFSVALRRAGATITRAGAQPHAVTA